MNLNPTAVIALLIGVVLVYSGVKNEYPQDVIRTALGKKALQGPISPSIGEGLGKAAGGAAQQLAPAVVTPGVTITTV